MNLTKEEVCNLLYKLYNKINENIDSDDDGNCFLNTDIEKFIKENL